MYIYKYVYGPDFSILKHNFGSIVARHSRDRRATVASAKNSPILSHEHCTSIVRLARESVARY